MIIIGWLVNIILSYEPKQEALCLLEGTEEVVNLVTTFARKHYIQAKGILKGSTQYRKRKKNLSYYKKSSYHILGKQYSQLVSVRGGGMRVSYLCPPHSPL